MSTDDLAFTSAVDLAAMIRERKVSPVELAELVLDRADATQSSLNAFITIPHDHTLAAAREAETAVARGDDLGPLHGVPFTVKDLVDTAGIRTTYGSLILEHNVPSADSATVARMKTAGAVLAGKVTTPEFGHKPMNEAPIFGRTLNPWDTTRTPGGSSGGSAAAVAAGIAPLSIGSDAGGSIRIPAACCGITGMKATMGLIPHDNAPDGFGNFSNQGPMARTVADTAAMLQVMAGADIRDPHSHGLPIDDYIAAARCEGDLKGLRVAYRPRMGNTVVDPEIEAHMTESLTVLGDLGAEIDLVEENFENTEPYWLVITQSLWVARFEKDLPEWEARMTPSLVRGIREGMNYSAADLQRAIVFRTQLFRRVQSWFEDYDLLVTPTLARTALDAGHDLYDPVIIANQITGKIRQNWYPYTHPFNMTGHPSLSVPCGWCSDGLPAGIQFTGPMMSDTRLLKVAALFERARPWAHMRPVVEGL
jgi:aspartyl-tRNA(Asn)/glutamyl-tRNA(Gln) amidotransferase subunit A